MKLEYGNHISHPYWRELCDICNKIETLKEKAKKLRKEIDKDVFSKKLLDAEDNKEEIK
ncbi:hypothetical protein LCGC14_0465730 [marine sediment metagenome]|uniref:Uncharacterized protein n=1 Tax=marine sediment metagenome TaxID=412755 RepID=A0A0F9SIX5_9ZZZZ